jgi:hypothetical protein
MIHSSLSSAFETFTGFIGEAFTGVGDFFGFGDGAPGVDSDVWDFSPDAVTGAIDPWEGGMSGGIGDIFDPGTLQNIPDEISGTNINLMDAVFNYNSADYSGLADIGGYMGLVGDVGGFMEAGKAVSWLGKAVSPSGPPGTEAAMAGTKSGSKSGVGQKLPVSGTQQQTGTKKEAPKGGSYTSPAQATKGLAEKLSFYGPRTAQSTMQRVGAASQLGIKAGAGGYEESPIQSYYKYLVNKQAMTPVTTSTLQTKYALK